MAAPSEATIQAQLKLVVRILENARAYADGSFAATGGDLDTLEQALEGNFLPARLTNASQAVRRILSDLVGGRTARSFLEPVLFEYGPQLTDGKGFARVADLWQKLYEHFVASGQTVETRQITYGTPAAGGANVGDLVVERLSTDAEGFDMEGCTFETKELECIADENSGAERWAEVFRISGAAASQDWLQLHAMGSGERFAGQLAAVHAGEGGSQNGLRNGGFSAFNAAATRKFTGWDELENGSFLSQDTALGWRTEPGAEFPYAMVMGAPTSGAVHVRQARERMALQRFTRGVPLFTRVMLNADLGTPASGGTVYLRLGSQEASATIASLTGNGWVELRIPVGTACWLDNFNEEDVDLELEWDGGASGELRLSSALCTPWVFVDGLGYLLNYSTASPTSAKLLDTYTVADSGRAPSAAKLQTWFWRAGLGYLPHSDAPTVTDP